MNNIYNQLTLRSHSITWVGRVQLKALGFPGEGILPPDCNTEILPVSSLLACPTALTLTCPHDHRSVFLKQEALAVRQAPHPCRFCFSGELSYTVDV